MNCRCGLPIGPAGRCDRCGFEGSQYPQAHEDRGAFTSLGGHLTGPELLNHVRAVLVKFVIFPIPEAADAVTLWIAATHAQPAWECAPRLQIRSPLKRCGKSRLLDLVENLSNDPLLMVLASPPALFRSIDGEEPPTLLLDEADTIFGTKERSENQEAIRGILNAGHQKGRTIPRCVPPSMVVRHFPTFAMAALAGIGNLPDTIEDRSVIVELHRRAPGETVAKLRWRHIKADLKTLREHLHDWTRGQLDDLREADPDLPVDDRAADTWEPLVAIADAAGADWPARARTACTKLAGTAATAESETNLSVRVLADLRDIFAEYRPADKAHTEALLGDLQKIAEAPWHNFYGHPLDARDLAKLLKFYGIKSRDVWIDGVTKKGYRVSDLWDAWRRYLPEAEVGKQVAAPPMQEPLAEPEPPVSEPDPLYPDARSARSARQAADQAKPPSPNRAYPLGGQGDLADLAHTEPQGQGADQAPSPPSPPSGTPWSDGTQQSPDYTESPVTEALRDVRCPSCRWRFQTAVQPGESAWCKCGHQFTVPGGQS